MVPSDATRRRIGSPFPRLRFCRRPVEHNGSEEVSLSRLIHQFSSTSVPDSLPSPSTDSPLRPFGTLGNGIGSAESHRRTSEYVHASMKRIIHFFLSHPPNQAHFMRLLAGQRPWIREGVFVSAIRDTISERHASEIEF